AMEDLRELKARNAELESQLTQAQARGARAPSAVGGALDWEAEKKRILAALESDFDEEDEEQKGERLQLEQVVQRTNQILAEKKREIADLQQLLADQSSNLGGVAVGAAALGEIFDQDAVIREQRDNLKKLQGEWEEKLRQAEVDLSVERAKIARERAGIEEKIRAMEERGGRRETDPRSASPQAPEKPSRGRWLARLGIKGADDD
ncbi:MAG TPA: hypothetical protein VMY37_03330, partial [Thermoguttaceae bacterium]|nr:hypothetical protein [Thermoguttaceae bacterium]